MKKSILAFLLMVLILSSCNNTKKEEQTTEHDSHEITVVKTVTDENHETTQVNSALNNNWMDKIQLDSGAKWLANIETTKGVQKMKDLLKARLTNTLTDYHNLALELTQAKNHIIKECTMKGPPHDNLHVWLLPLMEKIDALTVTVNIEEAAKIKDSIVENVYTYDIYFK